MTNLPSQTVGAAVIGYGGAFNMGREHAKWMNAAGMRTVAACDVDPARVASAADDFPGIATYSSVDDLLRDESVDLCVVILPHNLHAPVAIQCLNAGKHVVVEKPMCVSVEEADAMIEAADRNGKMLSVFHNRRWDGDFMKIRELIEQGLIGEVFHIEACMGGMHKPGTWWRSDKKISGGAMFDWGAHIVDWVLQFIPENIAGVDGYYHKLRWHESTNEDHTELVIRFESGKTAQVEISSLAAVGKARWRILGTRGAIVQSGWKEIDVTVDHEGHMAKFTVQPKETEWAAYYANIAAHLMHGEDLVVKPTQARRTIAAIEAAERSSSAKQTVVPKYK
ncbi:Gfo/Idh/MocA family protein [Fimbriimonas ginsengisoli]|uniref:Dehydrogenase-like protein n=1 Tax=Fimbriimonas ginsengisoli Gsoil 348 TaxID=661478 RepID=A0A068NZ60_FIMGI|nr:Gfo/Idh/MocA family oxidoreductase [Fimbriimonas ginsengisoli]AIE88009.1 dehydrogenase-like protein [Fimbriimonas ginsengisoli Gsoil 348]